MTSEKPRRRGRPEVVPGERLVSITIRLPEAAIERARELGEGNASAGIRRALEKPSRQSGPK